MALDLGPLSPLANELQEGSLDLEVAKRAAWDHGAAGDVSPEQLLGMTAAATKLAGEGGWKRALPVVEIGHEAARGAHESDPEDRGWAEIWGASAADLLAVLHHGLIERGDLRLYLRAVEVSDATIEPMRELDLPQMQGRLLQRLGTLLLDAYTTNKTPFNYEGQFDNWVARAMQADDPELAWLVSRPATDGDQPQPQTPAWPSPLDALGRAENCLRAALPLVIPERRGAILKALAQTLEWRGELGDSKDPDALREVCEQALNELEADDLQARLAVLATLERLGEQPQDDDLVRRLEEDWDRFAADTDPLVAWDAVGQAVTLLTDSDPKRALALLERHRELTVAWADENLRAQHFQAELQLFGRAYSPAVAAIAWDDIDAAAAQAREMAATASSAESARDAAAAIATVMLAAPIANREALALSLVDTMLALDHSLWADREPALAFMLANLLRGEGVNRVQADDLDGAAHYYQLAAAAFAPTRVSASMVQCIDYLVDVVGGGTTKLAEMTAWLGQLSLELELAAPATAPPAIQRLAGPLLAAQAATGISSDSVQTLMQVAKGRRFAAMLAEGTREFQLDEYIIHMLTRETQEEAALPAESDLLRPAGFDVGLGDDDRLTAWVNEYEKWPSDSPEGRVANVQMAVERRLTAGLLPAAGTPVPSLDEIRRHLDDRTALLQLFEGPWADGTLAVYQALVSRNDQEFAVSLAGMPQGTVQMSSEGHEVTMPATGAYVGALRRAVQEDPGPLDLAPEAAKELANAHSLYLRALEMCESRLREAGVERLVVVPHGSSHYLPVHLLGGAEPLADRFTVSYLSNVAQVAAPPRQAERRSAVGVFGLSYADQPRLPRLDDSAAEARAIAEACGTAPILDEAATEPAFKRALQSCRYVHLRAHGRLFGNAPSFHTVFLHPGDGHDGRLRAYEVLPLDLTGLELVTLGACETALSRVDRSDNPRGLPAALLLAGAQAVVGTLWPVYAAASTSFFTSLYRELMENGGDVAAAFAAAQKATRASHPEYRDWGAFYLIGGLGRGSA